MSRKLTFYRVIEWVIPRSVLWKAGRFLYQGARRELRNDPEKNGEYALLAQLTPYWRENGEPLMFYDIGANFADWSIELAEQLGKHGKDAQITAFEPAPAQAERAQKALHSSAASVDRGTVTTLIRSAVGAEIGEVAFEITGEATGNSRIVSDGQFSNNVVKVPCTALDAVHGPDAGPIHMIKVDTEGNDYNVIKGARELLNNRQIEILQFEYNALWTAFGYHLRDVFRELEGTDYAVGQLSYAGVEIYRDWHPELDRFFETNFLIIREDMISTLGARDMGFDASNAPKPL